MVDKGAEILGVDVGGVILDFLRHLDSELAFSGPRYLETPEIPDAIDSIARLNTGRFESRVYLVSKYLGDGPNRILEWLHERRFFEKTGIPPERFHPCKERHEKMPIARDLGITHFVDDRAEVLSYLQGVVPHLYLFQDLDEGADEYQRIRAEASHVESWKDLYELLK
jgi:hypothetical protein